MTTAAELVACHDCDLLHRVDAVDAGSVARCSRCNARLYANKAHAAPRAVPFAVASLILLVLANALPFMSFSQAGRVQDMHLVTGVIALVEQDFVVVAGLILVATIVAPLLRVVGLLYVLAPRAAGRALPGWRPVGKLAHWLRPWGMLDVFLLGVVVAIAKLIELAEVGLGQGFYAFAGLIVASTLAAASFEGHDVWEDPV